MRRPRILGISPTAHEGKRRFGKKALRAFSIVVALALAASLAQVIPVVPGAPRPTTARADDLPPETPPPPVSQADRVQVDAPVPDNGIPNPPTITFPDITSPDQILAGLTEDVSARTELSDTYQLDGVDRLMRISGAPLNYPSGASWLPISTKIVPDAGGGYRNEAASFAVHFPTNMSALTPVKVDLGDGSFTFAPVGASTSTVVPYDDYVQYPNVIPDGTFTYTIVPDGFKESIQLDQFMPGQLPVVFDFTATDLGFRQELTGDISVLDNTGAVVGIIPAPTVTDAGAVLGDPNVRDAYYTLIYLGGGGGTGRYRLWLHVDPQYMAAATYPVTLDPGSFQPTAHRDTWVRSDCGTCSYESSSELDVGNNAGTRYSWVQFATSNQVRQDRVTQQADLMMYPTEVADSTVPVYVQRGNGAWDTPLTYNNMPGTVTPNATHAGGTSNWYDWRVTDLYQSIFDGTRADYGMRLHGDPAHTGSNYHVFASSEAGAPPQLFVWYDDPPARPSLSSPGNGEAVTFGSPRLQADPVGDYNGDKVDVRYQVSTDSTFSTGVTSSSWLSGNPGWPVPAGVLLDGQTYYWRAQAWDECNAQGAMCDFMGKKFNGESFPTSDVRSFTVTLPHYGDDSKWPMWSDSLGNGMDLKVNEATGNLYLHYPLDSLATPAGALDLGVSYNSLDAENAGLGAGWVVAAGPASDPHDLPTKIISMDSGDQARVTLQDGDKLYFPRLDGNLYGGSGSESATVKKSDSGWTYSTSSGGQFSFDTSGNLTAASPATSKPGAAGFTYAFTPGGHLHTVTDPLGRTVTLTWSGSPEQLSSIGTWDNRSWTVGYDASGRLSSVTDPDGKQVTFAYNGAGLLSSTNDGTRTRTTVVGYTSPSGSPPVPPLPQVASVTNPYASHPTTFAYVGPYIGKSQIDTETKITDPRGYGLTNNSYMTKVDSDNAGLPIRIAGPANQLGKWPITTMAWDNNGNMLCQRSPAANAVAPGCTESSYAPDALQTDYVYDTKAPYPILTETGPAPTPSSPSADRPVTSYAYDTGINGLVEDNFELGQLQGIPASEQIVPTVSHNWMTTTAPPGIIDPNWWSVRWTGRITFTDHKIYHFKLFSADGVRMSIGAQTLVDCFGSTQTYSSNCGSSSDATANLYGRSYPITVEFQHQTGGARIDLQWNGGGSGTTFTTVPTSMLTPATTLLTSTTDPRGLTTTNTYDLATMTRQPTQTSTTDGTTTRTTAYAYDSYGRVLSTTTNQDDPALKAVTTNTYALDSSNLDCLTNVVDPAQQGVSGAQTVNTCDGAGDVLTTDQHIPAVSSTGQAAQDRWTVTTYDGEGREATVTTSDGTWTGSSWTGSTFTRTVTNTYDGAGRLIRMDDAVTAGGSTTTRTTRHAYDDLGHTMTDVLPDPQGGNNPPQVVHSYDDVGNEISTTDARGYVWTKTYDAANRVTSAKDPYQNATLTTYDDTGQGSGGTVGVATTKVTDPMGVATVTATDLLGRKKSEQVGNIPATTYSYYPSGDVKKVTDPMGAWTSNVYDAWGEMTKSTRPTGTSGASKDTLSVYDAAGHLTRVTDARGNVTTYGYDSDGRITSVTPPGLGNGETPWAIAYDTAGERVTVTDPDGRVRKFTYDRLGRAASYTETQGSGSGTAVTTTSHYDGFSQLTSMDDPRNLTLHFAYDNLGRKTRRYATAGAADDESYTYDATGNMLTATNPAGTVSMTYDHAGRIKTVTEGSGTTTYFYDTYNNTTLKGQLLAKQDPAGITTYGYDATNGRLTSLTDPLTGAATGYGYDDAARTRTRTDPSGLLTTRSYDVAGRVTSEDIKQGTATVASFSEQLDAMGNVTSLTQTLPSGNTDSGTWSMHYDPMGRMDSATDPENLTTTYGYDGAGNRTSVKKGTAAAVTTTYDGADLPLSASDGTHFTFDKAGNMTAVSGSADGWRNHTFGYDAWGRQTNVDSTGITYAYDALDRMLNRTKAASSTSYAYSGKGESIAQTTSGATVTDYAFTSGGSPLSTCQVSAGACSSSSVRVFERNLHGDLSVIANTSAVAKGTHTYSPFGEQRTATDTGEGSIFSFQSDFTDPDTRFVDMGTRLYDSSQGRFSTRDILFGDLHTPLSLNQYVYGLDNPATQTDSTGMAIDGAGGYISRQMRQELDREYVSSQHEQWLASINGPTPLPPPAPPTPAGCGFMGLHCAMHAVHSAAHWVNEHKAQVIQGALLVTTVVLTVATDGAAAPLLGEELAAEGGAEVAVGATVDAAEATVEGGAEATVEGGAEAGTEGAGEGASCPGNSFVAGTPVLLANGKTIPIQQVKIGTRVMSMDQNDLSTTAKRSKVVGLIRHRDAELYLLTVDHTRIEATGNHPFYVKGRGWVAVRDLRRGMRLEEYGGKIVHLTRIVREVSPAVRVYNFTVGRTHTYFAGRQHVLVHNCPGEPGDPTSPNQMRQQVARGQAPRGVDDVHGPHVEGDQSHIHFDDGSSLNQDGTWHHGESDLPRRILDWIWRNGWNAPE